jgi:hypothetical protein
MYLWEDFSGIPGHLDFLSILLRTGIDFGVKIEFEIFRIKLNPTIRRLRIFYGNPPHRIRHLGWNLHRYWLNLSLHRVTPSG